LGGFGLVSQKNLRLSQDEGLVRLKHLSSFYKRALEKRSGIVIKIPPCKSTTPHFSQWWSTHCSCCHIMLVAELQDLNMVVEIEVELSFSKFNFRAEDSLWV